MLNALRAPPPCLALVAILSACSGSTTNSNLVPDGALTVDPATAEVATSGTQQFRALQGSAITTAVSWAATGGSISASGLYTAPASVTGSSQQFVVTATSTADSTRTATATVTVTTSTPRAATPTFTPGAGQYATPVTISCATAGATIHYTTDGTTPTSASPVYSSALSFAATTLVNAICSASGYLDSDVASALYTVGPLSTKFSTGYYVYYEQNQLPFENVHWQDYTHLIFHTGWFLKPLPGVTNWTYNNGNPNNTGPYPVLGSQDINQDGLNRHQGEDALRYFAQTVHSHGIGAIIGLGSNADYQFAAFDYNTSTAERRVAFADQLIAAANAWGFDGYDFDWEAPSARASAWNASTNLFDNFVAFLQELKTRRLSATHPTRPNQPVITTFPCGYATLYGGFNSNGYDAFLRAAAPYLDQIWPMTYVATYFQSEVVFHQAPLAGINAQVGWDIPDTMQRIVNAGVPKEKVGVGLAAYGINYHGQVGTPAATIGASKTPYQMTTEFDESLFSRYGGRKMAYFAADGSVLLGGVMHHDTTAGATYYTWDAPGIDHWTYRVDTYTTLLTLDDAWGWDRKIDWVLANDYGGIMVWSLQDGAHVDGTQPELDTLQRLIAH